MRDILFRGVSKYTHEWVIGWYSKTTFGKFPIVDAICDCEKAINGEVSFEEIIPKTLGQYTGFTMFSGEKLFEGDIIELPINGRKMFVFWNDESMQWEVADIGTKMCNINHFINCFALSELRLEFCYEEKEECFSKIVGNIHDQ